MTIDQAIELHRAGQIDAAERAYQQILRDSPTQVEALVHYGVLQLQQGDVDAAEAILRQAVLAAPDHAEGHANLASALQAQGRHQEAAASFAAAHARRPDLMDVQFGLATALQACGRDAEAMSAFRTLLAGVPDHPEANFGLASLLARAGLAQEAISRLLAAVAADPDFAEAHLALGTLLASNAPLDAVPHFEQALDVDPDYLEARVALGATLSRLGRDDEAAAAFRLALAADPGNVVAHLGIGTLLDRKRNHAEAADHYRAVLARHPDHLDAIAGLSASLKNMGQHPAALELARRVLSERPESPVAASLMGAILAETGAFEPARDHFRRAARLAPAKAEYLYSFVELAKIQPGDAVLDDLETMLARIETLPPQEQCFVYFALAKAYDDIGQRDRGFLFLLRGNATKRAQIDYREAVTIATLDRIAAVFTPALLAAHAGHGDPSPTPVFVIGMPRSGTTLVEQILASHHAVFGAGERTDLSRVLAQLKPPAAAAPSLDAFWTLPSGTLRQLGSEYVAALRTLAGNAERIVDKLPANFAYAGLIRLILPNARIVHVRRDPVDTCLSCFSKLFAGEQPFSYELGELGRYYRAYDRLMAHWRAVLPADAFLEVVYEELVGDLEPQARRLIAHCGLSWDPACLEFYKAARPVHTASLTQVRQPIYQTSVGRWRPSPDALQPLLDGLAGIAPALPRAGTGSLATGSASAVSG